MSKKAPLQKCAKKKKKKKKKKKYIENFFLARFAHSAFYKIHISGAANRHASVQYAKYVSKWGCACASPIRKTVKIGISVTNKSCV